MSKPFKLSELDQFIGTQRYYRMSSRVVLTDGTHYLAERVGCYWLMDVIASYLIEARIQDWFVLATLDVQQSEGLVQLEDGNGHRHVSQAIPHTDFPFAQVRIYAVWDGEDWVLMLPSEY